MFKSYYYKKKWEFYVLFTGFSSSNVSFCFPVCFFSPLTPRIKMRRNEYLLPCPALLTVFSSFKWRASNCASAANIL